MKRKRKPYFRVREINRLSGDTLPVSTLYDAVRNGEIEALKLGAAIFIPEHEALRLLGEPTVNAAEGGDEAA